MSEKEIKKLTPEERFQTFPTDEFGQRQTPAAGSQIAEIVIKDEDHNGYFDKIKHRFVWMPMHDVNFIGRMQVQPMSFPYLYRGRTGWLQPVSYKAVDNSPDAMDIEGDGELPLRNFLLTPYAQALYLESSYAEKGIVLFEHLKGADAQFVAYLENIILPEVPNDLLSLGKYLVEKSPQNIEKAGLASKEKSQAEQMLLLMQQGTNTSIGYCRALIEESEAEILTRRNKGVGKAAFDRNDRFAFKMLRKEVPTENTLENSPERKMNDLLERFVKAVEGSNVGAVRAEVETEERVEEVQALRQELSTVQNQLAEALFAVNELRSAFNSLPTGAPTLEDASPVDRELAANDLKARLAESKSNQRKGK